MARKAKRMRLPNGFGRITEIKGKNLRNPFRVMTTVKKDSFGNPIGKIIGYYPTYNSAYEALIEYNKNPYDIESNKITFDEVYQKWSEEYFNSLESKSSIRTVKAAYDRTTPIRNMTFGEVRIRHLEGCINDSNSSPNIKSRMKSMFNLMYDWAVKQEIINTNYARNFSLNNIQKEVEKNRINKIPISAEHEQILWDNLDYGFTKMILINIYMGWRPQELALIKRENIDLVNKTIIGGMKTDAGTNRIIPIHTKVYNLAKYYYEQSEGSESLFNDELGQQGTTMTYDKYRNRFAKVMQRHNINNYSPSCPRHTFATKAKESNMNEYALKLLLGHEINDVTEKHYTHRNKLEWLHNEINKIK